MKSNSLKILNTLLISAFMMSGNLFANAVETEQAREIENVESKTSLEDNSTYEIKNFLGDEEAPFKVDTNKKETHIKSVSEIRDEKRAQGLAILEKEQIEADNKAPDIQISCVEMEYFEDKNELEARENVRITTANGTKASADRAVFNRADNTVKMYGNVILYKDKSAISGDYMLIDLNEENVLMNEPVTSFSTVVVNAQEGYAYSDRLEDLNGNIVFKDKKEFEFSTNGFRSYGKALGDSRLIDPSLKQKKSKPYTFKTKQIVINPQRDHDSMVFKDVDVYYKNKKVFYIPSFEVFSDKEMTYTEVDFPLVLGSLKGMGAYVGLGHVFKLPNSTLKLAPVLTYGDGDAGIGLMGQLKSKKLKIDGGWSTSESDLIVNGTLNLVDKLNFDFGRHAYKSEWFNGGNRAGYIGELRYMDSFSVPDFGKGAVFTHRATAGFVSEYRKKHQEKRDLREGMRYRYQAELRKELINIGSKEQDSHLKFSMAAQGMATVYSQGDVFGLFRMGPILETKVKRWNSTISYMAGGIHGASPYWFDEYRYGRHSIMFDESLILNKYISIGYRGTLTPLKDNSKKDSLTENRFYAVVGPEDMKVAFSYDAQRQNMNFDFLFLIGSDNLDIKYDRLTVKNPDKIGVRQRRASDKELYKVKIPEEL